MYSRARSLVNRFARRATACCAIAVVFVATPVFVSARAVAADETPGLSDRGLVARRQALLDLTNPFTVMCVACHPDDEDGLTLTLERRKYGARTVTLFATSGEGGQNAVGPELYEELGRIRERETVEASQIQGSQPLFLRLPDFGFSKTGDEAMAVWEKAAGGHDQLLRLFVAAIRDQRPDVIITNHDTSTGHGQHQATGRLLIEAIDAAADASRYRDAGTPWQPQTVLVRSRDPQPGAITIDGSGFEPVRGLTYREIAFQALLRHATQGPWRFEWMPTSTSYVPLTKPRATSERIGSPLTQGLEVPRGAFVVGANALDAPPDELRNLLAKALTGNVVSDAHRPRLIAGVLALDGIDVRLGFSRPTVTAGESTAARVTVSNSGSSAVGVKQAFLSSINVAAVEKSQIGPEGSVAPGAQISLDYELSTDVLLDGDTKPLRPLMSTYDAYSATARGSEDDAFERVSGTVTIQSGGLSLPVPVASYLRIEPPIDLRGAPVPGSNGRWTVHVTNVSPKRLDVSSSHVSSERRVLEPGAETTFDIGTPAAGRVSIIGRASGTTAELRAFASIELHDLTVPVAVAPGLRVGYVRSFEFTLPKALDRLGVVHRELSMDDIRDSDLSKFDTIVIDNRAYVKFPELARSNSRLLDFVRNGGTLIVSYHRREEYPSGLAPYPFTIGNGRVTDERAPVTILEPSHPVFTTPNRIEARDFDGWIQERGLYFPSEWAPEYVALLETHDPGEKDLKGGLIVAPFGKGHFVYTSFVWYRQLRASIPGGYRIFANLISLGKSRS